MLMLTNLAAVLANQAREQDHAEYLFRLALTLVPMTLRATTKEPLGVGGEREHLSR